MSRAVAPPVGRGLLVDTVGQVVEHLGQVELVVVLVPGDPLPDLVLVALRRRHVPHVLVDPVRRQAGHDALVPPRGLLDLLLPGVRRVPVVAHVVVVEDHQARQCRQQPAVQRVAPGQRVEVGVLLVVLELLAGRLGDVAPVRDEPLHLLGGLVGVDLVAEEQDQVRPARVLVGRHLQGEAAQRVDAVRGVAAGVVGDAGATRSVGHPQRLARLEGRDHARGVLAAVLAGGRRPHLLAVELDGVGRDGARLQPVHLDEGVVVVVHPEGASVPGPVGRPDGHPHGVPRLDPHRGAGLVDVPDQGAEDQRGCRHWTVLPVSWGRTHQHPGKECGGAKLGRFPAPGAAVTKGQT